MFGTWAMNGKPVSCFFLSFPYASLAFLTSPPWPGLPCYPSIVYLEHVSASRSIVYVKAIECDPISLCARNAPEKGRHKPWTSFLPRTNLVVRQVPYSIFPMTETIHRRECVSGPSHRF